MQEPLLDLVLPVHQAPANYHGLPEPISRLKAAVKVFKDNFVECTSPDDDSGLGITLFTAFGDALQALDDDLGRKATASQNAQASSHISSAITQMWEAYRICAGVMLKKPADKQKLSLYLGQVEEYVSEILAQQGRR